MNPDLDLRLASVIKALREVILPALPPEQRMAREQASLVLGHLAILAEQWPYALRYELECLADSRALAGELAALVEDGSALRAARASAAQVDVADYAAVSAAHRDLKRHIDAALGDGEGRVPLAPAVLDAVLRMNDRRAPRERSWFRGSGLDPDGPRLPPLEALFEREPS